MEIDKIKKDIGLKIRTFRRSKKLTQEEFSELVNIEQASLSNIENGKTYPTFSTICNLIENAKIEPNYLFDSIYEAKNEAKSEFLEVTNLLKKISPKYQHHIIEILKPIASSNVV